MLILVVDDEPVSRRLMGATLRRHNFEVVELSSGKEAVDFLQGHGPATMIVSDVLMPEMDGFDMLRFLKSDPRFRKIPVILVTSLNDTESVMKGIELGAVDYVTKPIVGAMLIAKVEKIISPQRAKVLVVDSEQEMRDAMTNIVERIGFAVLDVSSGEEAMVMLRSNRVTAIISNSSLPGISGIELLRYVKRTHPGVPVIFVTGSREEYNARDLLRAGADGFITKPFHNVEVVRKLRDVTRQML